MKTISCLLSFVLVSLIFATVASASSGKRPPQVEHRNTQVLLISIDGFRADYLEADRTPQLWALAKKGVRAKGLQPVFPSLTFPNHFSIVTGLYAEHHGIVSNDMIDPQIPGQQFRLGDPAVMDDPRWWQQGEPIWVTAEKQHVRSATMFWPGSSVEIHGQRPTYWKPYDQSVSNDARVDQVLAWLDLPEDQRPRLVTLYFDEVDTAGHLGGPLSKDVVQALSHVDAAIGRLLAGLETRKLKNLDVVIVSDHGMAAIDPARVIALDTILAATDFQLVGQGAMASLYPADGKLTEVYTKLKGANARMQVYKKDEVPERYHYRDNERIGPIVLVAEEGSYITSKRRALKAGNHGFDNTLPDMAGIFVAAGPDFKSGVTADTFANIHVQPMLTHILGLSPTATDGELKVTTPFLTR